jgi:hypothetical protein
MDLIADMGLSVWSSLRGAKRRSNPARAKRAKQEERRGLRIQHFFVARLPARSWIASLRSQ